MCGRFKLEAPFAELVALYNLNILVALNLAPRWNIAPSQDVPVVVKDEPQNRLVMKRWGLIPYWAKDAKVGYSMLNARADALTAKPAWREPFKKRRCLVIADGFYEWRKAAPVGGRAGAKRPYLIRRVGGEPIGFAGLYETWSDPTGGEIDTACIITTAANGLVGLLHDRMPAILAPEDFSAWLDVDGVEAAKARALLKPAPETALELVEIGTAVNRVANDDAGVQTPLAEPIRAAGDTLF